MLGSPKTRLAPFLAVALLALASAPAALGQPASVVAETTKGRSCSLAVVAERAGGAISYGGRVTDCSAKFGIRHVAGRAILYEGINTALTVAATERQRTNDAPLEIFESYAGTASDQYEARFGAQVVIKGGKSKRKPKKPEKWEDPGRGCRVTTSERSGDTLGCTLSAILPATP